MIDNAGWCSRTLGRSLSAMTETGRPQDESGAGDTPPTPPPSGFTQTDDRIWALIAHWGGAVFALISFGPAAFIVPLIAYLATRRESPVAQSHAAAALNFQIPISVIGAVLWVLHSGSGSLPFGMDVVVGGLLWLLQLATGAIGAIFGAVAGVKAAEGVRYSYPLNIKIVK